MKYMIFDDGNMVDCFDDEAEAMAALEDLAAVPGAAERLLLAAMDASGEAVATCIPGEPLVIPV
jgi:predicted ATP-grasp superfamily ATP-dependent carboligase